jgi:uncharacterized integral membrane protein (TIGR00698 family)
MTPPGRSNPAASNPYTNPELFRFVGSMEGVPDWLDPAETPDESASRHGWRARGHALLEMGGQILPGVGLAMLLAWIGAGLASGLGSALGLSGSPVSPILMAILLGLALRNLFGLPAVFEVGLHLALKRLLRLGVALLGIRLSLGAMGAIGWAALPIVVASIATALVLVTWVGRRVGLPARLATLIAVGTAICGNTAIVATGPAIGASEDETSYAVGCITAFGLLALIFHPFLAHGLFAGDATLAGYFLGTAIHDTAQVAGAGLLYVQQFGAPEALDVATVTKLLRNLFMVAVIPLMAVLHHRGRPETGVPRPKWQEAVPVFVFGFVAMTLLRTAGDAGGDAPFGGLLTPSQWGSAIDTISSASSWLLAVAMASVGLGTHLGRLRKLGFRPLLVGLVAALTVGTVSAGLLLGGVAS